MKKAVVGVFSILAAVLIMILIPTEADAEIYSDTLRLHILAASDSEEDQALKLRVRDAILAEYSAELASVQGLTEARDAVEACLADITSDAQRIVDEAGYSYTVTTSLCEEWYDTRDYGEMSLPRGVYHSLIIKIGEGEGHNWWCVMYPPMCLDLATDAPSDDWMSGYTGEEQALISGKYRVKFKILELISDFMQ